MPDISSNRSGSTGTRAAGGSRRAAGRDRGPRQPAAPASSAAPAPRGARAFAVRAAQLSLLALIVLPFALIVGGGLLALVVVLLTNFG